MKWIKITDECSYFSGAVNIGYIEKKDKGLLIDAGIDDSTAKKVLKQLKEKGKPITTLFITHAHTDHFGGAAYLQKHIPHLKTFAPVFEESILRNPRLEPISLFQGNEPLSSLRNKFLEGPSIKVDVTCEHGEMQMDGFNVYLHALPGHSYNQFGLQFDQILYAADSYVSVETLKKHAIPFLVDGLTAKQSFEKLLHLPVAGAVPGHGYYEEDYKKTVRENVRHHNEILQDIRECVNADGCIAQDDLLQNVFNKRGIILNQLSMYVLNRTALLAYVTELVKEGKIEFYMKENKIWVKQGDKD
ncbi:MBL fold metallo-hydrolase [Alkalihalobacillus sp. MEB130]|uniref:MBL fold metallo-hydrolase n=1 Tax=Alkalihalobacillus sp. MEB130 TaxID=2976704 RepID=UPI0028DE9666|nr:MBL fold metallo-hydrolase [Alkalihalobacillus sp. MEB130]MDT8862760.1 MBL fold metallo-hydrolase [Alkalihalobacillus sp. MEB130]